MRPDRLAGRIRVRLELVMEPSRRRRSLADARILCADLAAEWARGTRPGRHAACVRQTRSHV